MTKRKEHKDNTYGTNRKRPSEEGTGDHFGQNITLEQLFSNSPNNPYREMANPYAHYIFHNQNSRSNVREGKTNEGVNYGAVQIAGPSPSKVYPTRSKGVEYGTKALLPGYTISTHNDRARAFDSERTGLIALLNEYITERRQAQDNPLSYNPYYRHNIDNIRRPASPNKTLYRNLRNNPDLNPNYNNLNLTPYNPSQDYMMNRLLDDDEFKTLLKFSDETRRYNKNANTYGEVIKHWLEGEGNHINMLSERPACNHPDANGCSQFLPTIMPKGSHYAYTNALNKKGRDINDLETNRENLITKYNNQNTNANNQLTTNKRVRIGLARGGSVTYDKDFIALSNKIRKYLDSIKN